MILRATFENIYSIKDETQISFVAGKSNAHPSHVSRAEKRDDISVLKAGIVYGANASGKSNVIKTIALLQQIANGSFPQSKVEPFKLADTEEKNSKVEIEFKTDGLKIIFPSTRLQGISFLIENNDELQETTRSLLAYFNTGISDVRLYKIKKEEVNLSSDLLDNILSKAKNGKAYSMAATVGGEMLLFEVNANGGYEIYKQKAVHRNLTSGTEVVFDLSEESDGSIRLLDFIPMLIDLKQNEVDYLIDEIDRSMHPMLSQKILECYFSGLESGRDTQLIFSTHECNLLNLDHIRADEVWFVEKGKDGASHLTSLAEFKPREDVRKGYLLGRYGAIPLLPNEEMKW